MTDYSQYPGLRVERRGRALWVILDNPPLNSMAGGMHRSLARIFREISFDPQVGVVVLTGSGDRGFSAGGDIGLMRDSVDDHAGWVRTMHEAREIVLSLLECERPVIARINGHAIGVGATLALCCDITVMVETGKIGDTHVKVGLSTGDGGALLWTHLVGLVTARRYLLSGELLSGAEAERIGLITQSVPAEALDASVADWSERLGSGPSQALIQTKRSLNMALRRDAHAFMDAQLGLETLSRLSNDHKEAVEAFVTKRAPRFSGT